MPPTAVRFPPLSDHGNSRKRKSGKRMVGAVVVPNCAVGKSGKRANKETGRIRLKLRGYFELRHL